MQLHGFEVRVGDTVVDLLDGPMKVMDVEDAFFTVRVRNSYRNYDALGRAAGRSRTTLYWHDPIVIIPNKTQAAWDVQQSNLKKIMEIMGVQAKLVSETATPVTSLEGDG